MDTNNRLARRLALRDGRTLGYAVYGAPEGLPLLYFHGAGSSRLEPAYADEYARHNGIRVISLDRPGYGMSSPLPGGGFAEIAHDALRLADTLGLERFAVAGMSAGGPHALHLAAAAPARVRLVCLINASTDASHPAWANTPWLLRLLTPLMSRPPLLRRMAGKLQTDPAKAAARIARSEGWTQHQLSQLSATILEGLKQHDSIDTFVAEAQRVLRQPWKLDWAALQCPVLVQVGLRDPGRNFYHEMARRYPNVGIVDIPGPHMPIIEAAAWDRIGTAMKAALEPA